MNGSRHGWLALRLLLGWSAASLVGVWVADPAEPGAAFGGAVAIGFVALAGIAAWPRARARFVRALRGRLRFVDVLATNLVLLLVVAEVGVRIVARASSSPLFARTHDSVEAHLARYRGVPGAAMHDVCFNADGFFDDPFVEARPAGTRRIVALADSFGVGIVPFADNFLTRLDELLDRERRTDVYNLGVIGAGLPEYHHLYRTVGRRYEPDLVLLCFFVGNDVERCPEPPSAFDPEASLAWTVFRRLGRVPEAAGFTGHGVIDPATAGCSPETFLDTERARVGVCMVNPPHAVQRRWRDCLRMLRAIIEDVGPSLRVVLVPDEFQVDDALWAEVVGDHGHRFDRDLPNRRLMSFLRDWHVPSLDLLPVIREAARGGRTYRLRDTHWNARGNAAAADAIARWIRSSEWGRATASATAPSDGASR